MFVLVSKNEFGDCTYYYSGETYTIQGQRFANYVKKDEAKVYKSKKRAELAAESLGNKIGYIFIVEELTA